MILLDGTEDSASVATDWTLQGHFLVSRDNVIIFGGALVHFMGENQS